MTSNALDSTLNDLISALTMLETHATKNVLGRHGLRRTRYFILRVLHNQPGLTLGQVSEKTFIYGASASRTIYSMEKDGLVERENDESDRRIFTLALTEKGRNFYLAVKRDLDADIRERYTALDQETKGQLIANLQYLRETLIDYLH